MLKLRIGLRGLIIIFILDGNSARKMISHWETWVQRPYKNMPQARSIARLHGTNHATSSPEASAEVMDVALACSTKQISVKVQTTITEGMEGYHVQKADIMWALTIGQKDFSNNSAKDVSETYKTIFSDSQIAISF